MKAADSIEVISTEDYERLSGRAADLIAGAVVAEPELLFCAATGSTPTRTYQLLADKRNRRPGMFDRMRVIKLDEWGGVAMDDPSTCETYLQQNLVGPLHVSADRYVSFQSCPVVPEEECGRIRRLLRREGPIDLCLLGLGVNGHLGLNEPGETLNPFAHVAELSPTSLAHPMAHKARGTIRHGLTLGMADIMQSRKVLLLVSGRHKREQLRRLLSGTISSRFPASFLWMHADVTCLCDADAAPELAG